MHRLSLRLGTAGAVCLLLTGSLFTSAGAQDDQGGTLSVAFDSGIQYLDPALAYDFVSIPLTHLVFDTLIGYDDSTNLVPKLAKAMPTVSDDGLTFTFDLRPDVPFVRGGEVVRNVTAEDVAYSINRILRPDLTPNPSPVGPQFFGGIEGADKVLDGTTTAASGIKVVDEDTVSITLSRPDRSFLNVLAMTFGSIVPADIAGTDTAAFQADLVGTGPYYLESYTPDERAVFKRNPFYWEPGFPKADTVEVRLLVPAETQTLQVQQGTLDLTGNDIPAADWPTVSTDPELMDQIVKSDQVAVMYVNMDTSGPDSPFADPLVRQAVAHVIDKDNLVRLVSGRARAADCIFPPALPGHDPDCQPYPHSVERAKALMAEADNTGFSTRIYTDISEASRLVTESIISDLDQIGIQAELVQQDFDVLLGTISTPHEAPMVVLGWLQDFPDPSDFIDPILSCATAVQGGGNSSWYCNEAVDQAAAAARQVVDIEAAIPMYQELQRTIMADAPLVPTYFPTSTSLRSERVDPSVQMHPLWYWDLGAIPVSD